MYIMVRYWSIAMAITNLALIASCSLQPASNAKIIVTEQNSVTSTQLQSAFVTAVNNVRSKPRKCGQKRYPAAPELELNAVLNQAAHHHSKDMAKHGFFRTYQFKW